jgi:hypothetical protein
MPRRLHGPLARNIIAYVISVKGTRSPERSRDPEFYYYLVMGCDSISICIKESVKNLPKR